MTDYSPMHDPVDDPELRDIAAVVHEVLHEHQMRPSARELLRARLMEEASAQVGLRLRGPAADEERSVAPPAPPTPATQPLIIHSRRPGSRGPAGRADARSSAEARKRRAIPRIGMSALTAAAGLGAVLVITHGLGTGQTPGAPDDRATVQLVSNPFDKVSANPSEGLQLSFSQPLDQASVIAAMQLTPATKVTTQWTGNTLTVKPVNGFAPNSAYALTIKSQVARTAQGRALAQDIKLAFGTAPTVLAEGPVPTPVSLTRTRLAAADAGSEAVITRDGAVLLTSAHAKGATGGRVSALLRMNGTTTDQLGAATKAICVSRSGQSIAYLSGEGAAGRIIVADGSGTGQSALPVAPDAGTVLGWIGDAEVTYVSGGLLKAVDRSGQVRTLLNERIDTAKDVLVVAPGGRYLYLAHEGKAGRILDLAANKTHELTAVSGRPTFSADGSTVYWVEAHTGQNPSLRLNSEPSGGGPTLSVQLQLQTGDSVSDLAVSPEGSLLAYSVTRGGRGVELRLASLPSLATVASSTEGAGESPNWSPTGRMFTVLSQRGDGAQIQAVDVPNGLGTGAKLSTARGTAVAGAVAQAFANAQINGDAGAQQAIAPGVLVPTLDGTPTRANVLQVRPTGPSTAIATVRLSNDASSKQAVETLRLTVPAGTAGAGATGMDAVPTVTDVQVGPWGSTPKGPQLLRVDSVSSPGTVQLSFDSDLAAKTVTGAVTLVGTDGGQVSASVSYDEATRRIQVRPTGRQLSGTFTLTVSPALRDVADTAMAAPLQLTVKITGR